jgi:hypothetical protein
MLDLSIALPEKERIPPRTSSNLTLSTQVPLKVAVPIPTSENVAFSLSREPEYSKRTVFSGV